MRSARRCPRSRRTSYFHGRGHDGAGRRNAAVALLFGAGIEYERVTARTIDFSDLARDRQAVVTVHGVTDFDAFAALRNATRGRGYGLVTP